MNAWWLSWALRVPILIALPSGGPIVECNDTGLYSVDDCTVYNGHGGSASEWAWWAWPIAGAVVLFFVWCFIQYVRDWWTTDAAGSECVDGACRDGIDSNIF